MAEPPGPVTPAPARPIIFGEVLFDQFPDGSVVLGGAPFNVAWHLQAFGAQPLMISRIGNDPLGREIRDTMLIWGMDNSGMQLDSLHPTGTVAVSFDSGEPRFDIVEQRAYDFIDANILPQIPDNSIIYHGSLALRNETSHMALQKLKQVTGAPSFVDINLRAPWWTEAIVEQAMQEASWLKLNDHELDMIMPDKTSLESRIKFLIQKLTIEYLVLTQGNEGAVVVDRSGKTIHAKPEENMNVVDTVGAGDAFSSVVLLGQIKNWPLPETLQRAQLFASAIVGIRGAVEKSREFYEPFIRLWGLAEQ